MPGDAPSPDPWKPPAPQASAAPDESPPPSPSAPGGGCPAGTDAGLTHDPEIQRESGITEYTITLDCNMCAVPVTVAL